MDEDETVGSTGESGVLDVEELTGEGPRSGVSVRLGEALSSGGARLEERTAVLTRI